MAGSEFQRLPNGRPQVASTGDARVWMFGPALEARGGMASVAQSYAEAGLFSQCGVRYLNTYEGPGIPLQLRVFGSALLKLLVALLFRKVDLVHLHSATRGSFFRKSLLAALCRLSGVPYLFHLHSGEFLKDFAERWPQWKRRWAQRTLSGASRVIVLSESWKAAFASQFPGARCEIILNPVEVPDRLPDKRDRRNELLFLGRITDKKGAFDLLRALPAALARQPKLRLTLAGPGDIERAKQLVLDLGLPAGVVDFPGWIDGPHKVMALERAGTFVLPSHFEGVPIGILEAMAEGLAIVATRVGGIPDVVDSGRNGRLVPVGDIEALSEALSQVADEASVTETQVQCAFVTVQSHKLQAVVASLAGLYARTLAER